MGVMGQIMAYLSIWEYGQIYLCPTFKYGNMGKTGTYIYVLPLNMGIWVHLFMSYLSIWEYGYIYLWPTFKCGNMGKSIYGLPLNVGIWANLFMAYLSIWEYG